MAAWPSTLPRLALDTDDGDDDGLVVSEVDAGPRKRRRRWTVTRGAIRSELLVTGTQRATLEAFYETTLSGGVSTFTWIRTDGSTATLAFNARPRFRLVAGNSAGARRIFRTMLDLEVR